MWISIFKVWSDKNSDWLYLSCYLVTLDTRHPRVDGISGRRRPPPPVPGAWPRPLLMFLIPVPLSGGSGPSQVFGHVKLMPFYYLFLWMLGSTTEMSSVDDGSDSANAIDDDNTTSAITKDGKEWSQNKLLMLMFNFQVPLQDIGFPSFSLTLEEKFDWQKYPFLEGKILKTTQSWMLISDLVTIQTQGLIPTPKLQTMKGGNQIIFTRKLLSLCVFLQDVEHFLALLLFKINGLI